MIRQPWTNHLECGNLLPPLMTEFIPSNKLPRNEFRETER